MCLLGANYIFLRYSRQLVFDYWAQFCIFVLTLNQICTFYSRFGKKLRSFLSKSMFFNPHLGGKSWY